MNKEKWAYEDIRLSELDVKKGKYRSVHRYDFRFSVGKTEMLLKMYEEMSEWKKLVALRRNETSSFETLVREIGSTAVIDRFKIEGPFELRVTGEDDQMSLLLPVQLYSPLIFMLFSNSFQTVIVKNLESLQVTATWVFNCSLLCAKKKMFGVI